MRKEYVVIWDFGGEPCFYKYFKIRDKAKLFLAELRADEQPEGYQIIKRSSFERDKKTAEPDSLEYVK